MIKQMGQNVKKKTGDFVTFTYTYNWQFEIISK